MESKCMPTDAIIIRMVGSNATSCLIIPVNTNIPRDGKAMGGQNVYVVWYVGRYLHTIHFASRELREHKDASSHSERCHTDSVFFKS
jgi:hypothetical protein